MRTASEFGREWKITTLHVLQVHTLVSGSSAENIKYILENNLKMSKLFFYFKIVRDFCGLLKNNFYERYD